MIDRIRSLQGNVITADFRPRQPAGQLDIPVSVETIYADDEVILIRCSVGSHTWHMLGDIATGQCVSTT